jgi:hypothetical protein
MEDYVSQIQSTAGDVHLSHTFSLFFIKYSGGMPDDCTVLAMHCVGQDADDIMDQLNK